MLETDGEPVSTLFNIPYLPVRGADCLVDVLAGFRPFELLSFAIRGSETTFRRYPSPYHNEQRLRCR